MADKYIDIEIEDEEKIHPRARSGRSIASSGSCAR